MVAICLFLLMTAVNVQVRGGLGIKIPDPVAFYPLDCAHGTKEIKDRVGAGFPLGVRAALGPDGKKDTSYEFSGTVNSFIEFPNSGVLDVKRSITMLCWLLPGGKDGPIFDYKISGRCGVFLAVSGGSHLVAVFKRRDYAYTGAMLHFPVRPEDGWKFVGASYDHTSGDAKLWIDGNVVDKANIGANLLLATQDSVRMGARFPEFYRDYFKGRIAQMQVYNAALTKEQIQAIKSRTVAVKQTSQ